MMVVGLAMLAIAGAIDDIHPLPVLPRLIVQLSAAALMVLTFPAEARLFPFLNLLIERTLLVVGLVWFINLTNFMDGIDWMTVAETVPIAACLAALGLTGLVSELTPLLPVVLALLGGMLGFAPFNRHVARLFLGDVGSLPIGALVGWLLIVLALAGHLIAALILPLYYLADATITLIRRWRNGENIGEAHRSHFYQRATSGGFSVPQVTRDVFALNVLLAVLSVAAVKSPVAMTRFACLALAIVATLAVLWRFGNGAPEQRI